MVLIFGSFMFLSFLHLRWPFYFFWLFSYFYFINLWWPDYTAKTWWLLIILIIILIILFCLSLFIALQSIFRKLFNWRDHFLSLIWTIYFKIWCLSLCVWICFIVTLSSLISISIFWWFLNQSWFSKYRDLLLGFWWNRLCKWWNLLFQRSILI